MQIMHMNWKTGKMEPDTPENRICRTAKIYRVLPEQLGQIDCNLYLNSVEVSEAEFIAEYRRRNRR